MKGSELDLVYDILITGRFKNIRRVRRNMRKKPYKFRRIEITDRDKLLLRVEANSRKEAERVANDLVFSTGYLQEVYSVRPAKTSR